MNSVILMGRLTRDPEVRKLDNTTIARYSIAVDRRYKRDGQPEADFFDLNSFGKQAEFVEKYLKKGTKVVIRGRIENNNYTNKDGQKVYATRIMVEDVEFAESKAAASGTSGSRATSEPEDEAPMTADPTDDFIGMTGDDDIDDLPFS